jgi:secreted PhoX family phosphatase
MGGWLLSLDALLLNGLSGCRPTDRPPARGYGELLSIPSENTGETLLALPPGFRYNVFGRTGDRMTDGRPTPAMHDGMAAFGHEGQIRLIRNHENHPHTPEQARCIGAPERSFDPRGPGGTTTLVVDPESRLLIAHWVSLSGTVRNCAGGPTPWHSWITCEESVMGTRGGLDQPHGYCFDVPVTAAGEADPIPLRAMGRFVHEAVAVDPDTGIVYETEDATSAGFYRFIPSTSSRLAEGGRLEMLGIEGHPGFDTRTGLRVGQQLQARWIAIEQPDPADAEQNGSAVYQEGFEKGGAVFGRLEGCWYGDGNIYINATSGGNAKLGQVWQYRPQGKDAGELTLIFESTSRAMLRSPDNLCVSPRGGLVLCEDGPGDNHLRGLTREGKIFDLARNLEDHQAEFAGATFSPDGSTLFVNVQTPGYTLAIWGDWSRGVL